MLDEETVAGRLEHQGLHERLDIIHCVQLKADACYGEMRVDGVVGCQIELIFCHFGNGDHHVEVKSQDSK